MTDHADPGADPDAVDERVMRLERRLAREREAREQAERIAEHGMRNLWQTNRDLERRVVERTTELERSLAAATIAAEAKERFLADLSHELTTPLHAVLGLLELIDVSALQPDDLRRIDEIRGSATELSELLSDLIELASATGPSAPDDVTSRSASDWVDEVVDGQTRRAALCGQLLVPSVAGVDGPVALDWRRLSRITRAVLAHANEHGDPGTVRIDVAVRTEAVEVQVVDSGPGTSATAAATAFEPFVTHGPGSSLNVGLPIAHRLAVGAGGELSISGDEPVTTVRVVLPRAR